MSNVKMIGSDPLTELESLVCLFAIEHGDALPHTEIGTNEAGDHFRVDGWITPKIVLDHDEKAMKAYLARATEPDPTHNWHRDRTPAVCCNVADFLGQAHPFVGPCADVRYARKGQHKGREMDVCGREDCPQHVEHLQQRHEMHSVARGTS